MNAVRRKSISKIWDKLEELKIDLEALADEEREAFENLPEGIQYSERGEAMEEAADSLQEQADALQDILDALSEVTEI